MHLVFFSRGILEHPSNTVSTYGPNKFTLTVMNDFPALRISRSRVFFRSHEILRSGSSSKVLMARRKAKPLSETPRIALDYLPGSPTKLAENQMTFLGIDRIWLNVSAASLSHPLSVTLGLDRGHEVAVHFF